MGLARGLVRRVFSKARSSTGVVHDGNERSFGVERSRWSSVRIYLCGDEFNSLADGDLASVEGMETAVMRPITQGSGDQESYPVTISEQGEELITNEEEDSSTKLLGPEDAAISIQSAFRGLLARRRYERIRRSAKGDHVGGLDSPLGESEARSTEVQIGDSAENLRAREDVQHRMLHKVRSQVYRLKEEWDDSTLSSNIAKLRIQNRLEATTRRERALAYAFSQQLRTCTKKKSARSDSTEPNMGWSWLERWMATRLPESSAEDCLGKHLEPMPADRRPTIIRRRFDLATEEKESCGSNDVSVGFDGFATPCQTPTEGYGPVKSRLRDARALSRRRTSPDYHHPPRSTKVSKKSCLREAEKEGRCKQMPPKSAGETECQDASLRTLD